MVDMIQEMHNNTWQTVLRSRIQAYQYDKDCIKKVTQKGESDWNRMMQDEAIVQELSRILYGDGLDRLVYVDQDDVAYEL